ncbi:MAG: OmcA/MtrC family decaheme c-type cytochrome, partial [Myxococcota bacterium]
ATASCNECHDRLALHGSRYEVRYCTLCHAPTVTDADTGNSIDLAHMVHAIHGGAKRLEQGLPEYTIASSTRTYAYGEVTYPMGANYCKKCHNGADTATAQGDNWKNNPNMEACSGCHNVAFVSHNGQDDDSMCADCHDAAYIADQHAAENNSPNATAVVAGAVNFAYEVSGVTVNGTNQAEITFRILVDGVPFTFPDGVANLNTAGFNPGPSFLVTYADTQDGVMPIDLNNRGNAQAAAQPRSVAIYRSSATSTALHLIAYAGGAGSAGSSLTGPDASGYYVATMPTAAAFPATATLRGVALQGYFTQRTGHNGIAADTARHTVAAVKYVTGEERRSVVASAKCGNCHEWFEGHGGNRVYTVDVCVTCHNPNLSTSGRGADPALIVAHFNGPVGAAQPAGYTGTISQGAYDAAQTLVAALEGGSVAAVDPLVYPESSNNLKDMIHGIHASGMRAADYTFVRDRGTSGIYYYDWAEVTFPGVLNNCETCHLAGTYELPLAENALPTTVRTTSGAGEDRAAILAARTSAPNATDLVNSPIGSTCYFCHDDSLSTAHMEQNGSYFAMDRATYYIEASLETCALCHGPGTIADVVLMHDK